VALRIDGPGISTSTQTGGPGQRIWMPQPGQVHPMAVLLFGRKPPRRVDRRKYPKLGKAMRKLGALKDQIAPFAGRNGAELSLELCEGDNASISESGIIHVGVGLLGERERDDDFLVAMMGHEIGHRPWEWTRQDVSALPRAARQKLCREEEAKADRFAGRVLADLDASPDSICEFFLAAERFEGQSSAEYYPADVRAEIIREAFSRRRRALKARTGVAGFSPRLRDLR
jgi:hypothetical protein